MKTTRKLLALLIAVVMIMSMLPTAFAESEQATGTITVNAIGQNDTAHTYEFYQIFVGDVDTASKELTNAVWGANGKGTQGEKVPDSILMDLAKTSGDTARTAVVAQANLTNPAGSVTSATQQQTITLPTGYYLVKDKDGSLENTGDSYTAYVIVILSTNGLTLSTKADVPSMMKKLKDTNDSTGTVTNWQDSADYDIGDTIPFRIQALLPGNVTSYAGPYVVEFVDTMEHGLTFNGINRIYLTSTSQPKQGEETDIWKKGEELPEGITIKEAEEGDDWTFKVSFEDVRGYSENKNNIINVEYECILNETANLGYIGNENTAHMEFSNNPNWTGTGTPDKGKTPDDTVIVFTYKVVVNKVDGDETALPGATFSLYKKNAASTAEDKYELVGQIAGDTTTSFSWSGLDDGDYKLVEDAAPEGYNKLEDPILFTVEAEHVKTYGRSAFSGHMVNMLTSLTGDVVGGTIVYTPSEDMSTLTAAVQNKLGSVLPETGGMGTTLFYVVGSVMVLAAIVLLVSKKRMNNV